MQNQNDTRYGDFFSVHSSMERWTDLTLLSNINHDGCFYIVSINKSLCTSQSFPFNLCYFSVAHQCFGCIFGAACLWLKRSKSNWIKSKRYETKYRERGRTQQTKTATTIIAGKIKIDYQELNGALSGVRFIFISDVNACECIAGCLLYTIRCIDSHSPFLLRNSFQFYLRWLYLWHDVMTRLDCLQYSLSRFLSDVYLCLFAKFLAI